MLNNCNLQYIQMLPYWEKMKELYCGEKVVKDKGTKYLPPSSGMVLDGMGYNQDGYNAYQRYVQRAEYINHIKQAVETYVGLCHQEQPTIELPKELEYLREKATNKGESLEGLLRKINAEQIKTGRCGLFVDLATSEQGSKPYISFYDAESIINWNETDNYTGNLDLGMLVLREIVPVLKDFSWEEQTRYRVCLLGDGSNPTTDFYRQGIFDDETFDESKMFYPSYLGTKMNYIPFVFINSCDCVPDPDYPPLDDLANESLLAYRLSADYHQGLHFQGQDTLLIKGHIINHDEDNEDGIRTGAGSVINVGSDGDAKYIGVSGDGLPELRKALDSCYSRCDAKSGRLVSKDTTFESGESLKTRLTAQTCNLNRIALTGAYGLSKALKTIAIWLGADPNEVKVTPNMEFSDFSANGDDVVKLITAKQQGLPISYESIYDFMTARGYVKIPFATQVEQIKKEKELEYKDLFVQPTELLNNNLADNNAKSNIKVDNTNNSIYNNDRQLNNGEEDNA